MDCWLRDFYRNFFDESRLTCPPISLRNFLRIGEPFDSSQFAFIASEDFLRHLGASCGLGLVQELFLLFEGEFFDINSRCPQVFMSHETLDFPRVPTGLSSPEGPEIGALTVIVETIPVGNTRESCIFSQDVCSMLF